METARQGLYTEKVLDALLARYEVEPEHAKKLGEFESFIYEVPYNGDSCILKISHSSHRTKDQIDGELAWVNHLVSKGLPIVRPLKSLYGNYVEEVVVSHATNDVVEVDSSYEVSDNDSKVQYSSFLAILFEKARGVRVELSSHSKNLYYVWGQTLGRMHAETKSYVPHEERLRRFAWDDDQYVKFGGESVPREEVDFFQRWKELKDRLDSLQKNVENYGLIHTDLHRSNFFVEYEEESAESLQPENERQTHHGRSKRDVSGANCGDAKPRTTMDGEKEKESAESTQSAAHSIRKKELSMMNTEASKIVKALSVFDTDDCAYNWFALDLGNVFYYSMWDFDPSVREQKAYELALPFVSGYLSANDLAREEFDRISLFIQWRDLVLFSVLHVKLDLDNLTDRHKSMLADMRQRIIDNQPIVRLDWCSIYDAAKSQKN